MRWSWLVQATWLLPLAFCVATAGAVSKPLGVFLVAFLLIGALAVRPPVRSDLPRAARWAVTTMIVVGVVQLTPLPEWLRAVVAPGPTSARRDLREMGLQGSWMPISVDLGWTVIELLYWAGAAALLALLGRREGPPAGARLAVLLLVVLCGVTWIDRRVGTHVFPLTRIADPWGVGQENLRGKADFAGWLINRNHWAALGLVLWPLAAWWTVRRRSWAGRVAGGLATLLVVASVVETNSRTGLAAVGLQGAAVLAFLAWKLPRPGRWAVMLLTAGGIVVGWPQLRAYADRITHGDVVGRARLYEGVVAMGMDSPFLGWGLGTFRFVFPAYQPDELLYRYTHAHQDVLQMFTDAGVFGLAVVALLGVHAVRCLGDPRLRGGARLAWLLAVSGCGIVSLVEFPLQIPAIRFLWLGVLFAGPGALPGGIRDARPPRSPNATSVARTPHEASGPPVVGTT
jgi:hypothetical protein